MKGKVIILTPEINLVSNNDGTYDLWINYTGFDVEFAEEADIKDKIKKDSKTLSQTIRSYAKNFKIKSVKILLSGAVIATLAFSAFITSFAASDKYTMGYLYSGTDHQQIEYVNQTNGSLDVVSPSYFDIREDGSLKLNYLSPYLIKTMHDKGIKVVPFLSNHWNRTAGINALKDVESLSDQIARYVEEYDLDGVNVDIENVTHEQRDQYTELVRLLREKIPENKEVSVAVAANPNNWQTGWHGSYDYAALAKYADHLMIMAYDEHYEGGEAGPVASIDFVEKSVKYALSKTTPEKIVLGVPFYGRVWSTDGGNISGKGVSTKVLQQIISECDATVTYDNNTQSLKAEFTVTAQTRSFTVGVNTVLKPGKYVAWFENDQSYQAKLSLVDKYNLKGAGAWSLGQEDTSIWEHYEGWMSGETGGDITPEQPSPAPDPDPSLPPEEESTPPEDTNPLPPSPEYQTYIVKSGDSLWNISKKFLGQGSRYREIMTLNNLKSDRIYPGMELKIPSDNSETVTPDTPAVPDKPEATYFEYTVVRGDSLWKISKNFLGAGSRYKEIMSLNGLKSETIRVGQKLKIPAK